jgi:endonuclease/exonuclease/phosphatase (EEP) superfamily protein YafD
MPTRYADSRTHALRRYDAGHMTHAADPARWTDTLRPGFWGGLGLLCAGLSLSGFMARLGWPSAGSPIGWMIGLASHWQWLYAGVAALAALIALWVGPRLGAWLALGIVAASVSSHVPGATQPVAPPADGPRFVVASANLDLHNRDFEPLRRWLLDGPASEAPDVVFLQEFTPEAQLAVIVPGVRVRYPHQWLAPSGGPFGLAILSRHPFIETRRIEPANEWLRLRLRAVVRWNGQEVALSAVHPMPPLRAPYAAARDRTLREEAQWLATGDANRLGVLAGDLNDTPWSSGVQAAYPLLRAATSTRPTWPNAWQLPLDHVLVTSRWQRIGAEVGPDLNSDHRPVRVELRLAAAR